MKKKILVSVSFAVLLFLSVFTVNLSKKSNDSKLNLQNLIAMSSAQGEGSLPNCALTTDNACFYIIINGTLYKVIGWPC